MIPAIAGSGYLHEGGIFCGANLFVLSVPNRLIDYGDAPAQQVQIHLTLEQARIFHLAFPEIPVIGPGKGALSDLD